MKTVTHWIRLLHSGDTVDAPSTGRIGVRIIPEYFAAIIFWSLAVFLLLGFLSAKELWGPEDRWAEVVREMRLTGDYFHPTINGKPYFDKPLLGYWVIALAAAITGRLDEGTVRLPSAIAGLLALWGTISLERRLWSKKLARTAGWVLLGTYGFIFWARTGEADMENLAAVILAVAWYWSRRDRPGFFSYLIFYLICFLGAHTKGMATIALPIMVILPDIFREKRWRSHVSISHFLALLVGLLLYLAPFIYSDITRAGYQDLGLWYAFRENIVRYFRPFDHKEPFYVYFYYLPVLFLPLTVLLVSTVCSYICNFNQLSWPTKWVSISSALIFLFFTLSGSRRSYYILPLLPFCSLMVSQYISIEPKEHIKRLVLHIQTGFLVFILLSEILSPLIWPVLERRIGFSLPGELKLATFILGLSGLFCFVLDIFRPGLLSELLGAEQELIRPIIISVIIIGGFFLWQQKSLKTYNSMKPFSMELRSKASLLGPANIAFFRKFKIKTLFYINLREPVPVLEDANAVRSFLNSKNGTKVLVSYSEYLNELADVLPPEMLNQPTLREKVYPWEKRKKEYQAWIINSDN